MITHKIIQHEGMTFNLYVGTCLTCNEEKSFNVQWDEQKCFSCHVAENEANEARGKQAKKDLAKLKKQYKDYRNKAEQAYQAWSTLANAIENDNQSYYGIAICSDNDLTWNDGNECDRY